MEWFIALLAVVVIGFAAVAASGGLGQFGPIEADRPPLVLPKTPLTSQDVKDLEFFVVPRGYAMEQVDELLSRLQKELPQPDPVFLDEDSALPSADTEPPSGDVESADDEQVFEADSELSDPDLDWLGDDDSDWFADDLDLDDADMDLSQSDLYPESGIIGDETESERRNHDGSDETSNG
ncbi:MAG: DivIVA domain-containing protein [Propionibacteriaceae bacterium]|nr:DivIVA domain-containing protein [Propionibacteriaceae bacterium]